MAAEDRTRQRLLDAALGVFAERGFAAASVRTICEKAGANIAAVNYHFGDKQSLYVETVKYAHRAIEGCQPMPEWPADMPALERLRGFIAVMVRRMHAEHNPVANALLMREMSQPSGGAEAVVREYIGPVAAQLRAILGELRPGVGEHQLWMTGFSIVGQILFYKVHRPIAQLLMGAERFRELSVADVTDHVTRFTLNGLQSPPVATGGAEGAP